MWNRPYLSEVQCTWCALCSVYISGWLWTSTSSGTEILLLRWCFLYFLIFRAASSPCEMLKLQAAMNFYGWPNGSRQVLWGLGAATSVQPCVHWGSIVWTVVPGVSKGDWCRARVEGISILIRVFSIQKGKCIVCSGAHFTSVDASSAHIQPDSINSHLNAHDYGTPCHALWSYRFSGSAIPSRLSHWEHREISRIYPRLMNRMTPIILVPAGE